MNIVAAIAADLERSPLGGRSRLADDLLAAPILRRTVERALRVQSCSAVHVLCPADQEPAIRALLEGLPARIDAHAPEAAPYRALVTADRLWGLDGWRGGVGSLCVFDEDIHVARLLALAEGSGADAILSVPAAAPLIDPELLDAMARHFEAYHESAKVTIVQAPPGLAALIIHRCVLSEIAPTGLPPGALLVYQPNHAFPDLTGREGCYRPPTEIVRARGRLLCDTHRALARVRRVFDAGGAEWSALRIARWLNRVDAGHVAPFPEEIELELTTDDPLPEGSLLRPRGSEVPRRGPIELRHVRSLAESLGAYDDVRFVLGGFGEPTRHPRFGEICRILRDSPAAAIAVRTRALDEAPSVEAALFETPIDVVEVTLDAATAETYRRVNGADAFEKARLRLECWLERRARERRVLPVILPSMIKAQETLDDLEPFVDTWQARLGMVLVSGYSHCAGQRPHRAVCPMAPPDREVCRRVRTRTLVLADGRVTTCDQDFAGRQTLGRLDEQPLGELWGSSLLENIRTKTCGDAPLCAACDEWHRP